MNRWIVVGILVGSARVAGADKTADCKARFEHGSQLFGDKHLDQAVAEFASAYKACGAGHGFLGAEGFVRATQGKLEDAAAFYLQEIGEQEPQAEAFGNLEQIRDKLSAKTRARIVALGGTATAPVHVRGVAGEYSWARAFTCLGAKALGPTQQSIAKGDHDKILDRLDFTCPNEPARHVVFFDYGTDPQEEAYKREREAIDAPPQRPAK